MQARMPAARRLRTPITDGAYGKPWVYRYKDLVAWWSKPHYNRVGGVEVLTRRPPGCHSASRSGSRNSAARRSTRGQPAERLPRSEVDRECHALFLEWRPLRPCAAAFPRSASGLLGCRSAHDFEERGIRSSPVYGGRMVDTARIYLWAWDARPFPAFPLRDDLLVGRRQLAPRPLAERPVGQSRRSATLINAILADHGPAAGR